MPPPSRSVSSSRRPAGLPAAPPDLWLHLRKIPSGDWSQMRDPRLPRPARYVRSARHPSLSFLTTYSSDERRVFRTILTYLPSVQASTRASPTSMTRWMPSALLSFHQGLSRAVASLDEDAVIDNGLDGVSWPPDAFSSTTPLSLTKAEARNLERPHPKPYATFKAPAPPSSSSFGMPGLRPPTAPSSSFPGSGYPYGPLLPPADVEMGPPEDADAKRDPPDGKPEQRAHHPVFFFAEASATPPGQPSCSGQRWTATVPGVIKVKHESGQQPASQQPSGGKEKEKKKGKGKGTQNAPMVCLRPPPSCSARVLRHLNFTGDFRPRDPAPTVTKVTRSQVPGAKPAVPLKETLELPPHATEEEAGGAGSSKRKGKAAKIQDKGEGEGEDDFDPVRQRKITGTKQFAADRPRKTEEGKSLNKNIFSMLISLLPDQARLDLPRTDDGRYYKITYDLVRQVLRIGDPHVRATSVNCRAECVAAGVPCDVRRLLPPARNEDLNLDQPDEINSDGLGRLHGFTDMSSDITEGLTRSFGALESLEAARTNLLTEYHFNFNCSRSWSSSFAAGEMLLRVAMSQQLTADTEVTRAYVWQYYEYEHLHLDLPVRVRVRFLSFDLWSDEYARGRESNPSGSSGARQRLDDQYFAECRPVFNQVFAADLLSKGDEVVRHVFRLYRCQGAFRPHPELHTELRRPANVINLLRERLDVLCARHGLVLPANMQL
ncbi:hypothetical protein DFH06DRAFT_1350583 [Mycena polygramma]|nr:hypothetical protein DFH06DRAFT_1350583 [Mycena polygramma]